MKDLNQKAAKMTENETPWWKIKRMNNTELVRRALNLASGYKTTYVNGTVGQLLTDSLITANLSNG